MTGPETSGDGGRRARTCARGAHRRLGGRRLASALTRFGRGVALILAVLSAPAATGRDPDAGWFKLVTPNFELYGNGRESEARRLMRELETFRHVVSRFLGLTNEHRRPALVFYFDRDESFRPYKPSFDGTPSPVSGFHTQDPLDYALALSRQPKGSTTMRVLFHEYTHLLTARQFRRAPLWVNEGVAEVFSTFEGEDDRFDIGVALTNHVFDLYRRPPMPLSRLLTVTHASREYNEATRAGSFYATSWALAHYLLFARRGFETNVMARYAEVSAGTTNLVEAFRVAFGATPEELQPFLQVYLRGGSYTVVRQSYPDLTATRPSRARLAPGELDFALGRLLQLVQHNDRARERLERSASAAPRDPRPHEALALLAWRQRERQDLIRHGDRAIELGSREAFVHFLAAQARYETASDKSLGAAARNEAFREGRRHCEQALALDPDLAAAHHLLGVFVLSANPGTPALAAVHIEEALRCDPQYRPALLTRVSLLAMQRDFDGARRALAGLLAGPLPADLRATANQIALEIEAAARTAGGGPAP